MWAQHGNVGTIGYRFCRDVSSHLLYLGPIEKQQMPKTRTCVAVLEEELRER